MPTEVVNDEGEAPEPLSQSAILFAQEPVRQLLAETALHLAGQLRRSHSSLVRGMEARVIMEDGSALVITLEVQGDRMAITPGQLPKGWWAGPYGEPHAT